MTSQFESQSILHGAPLARARLAWLVVALIMFGAMIASWPPFLRLLNTVCETCPMTPAYARALQADGISGAQWVALQAFPAILVFLGWMGMGVLIFLLKSNDRRGLLYSTLLILIGASFGGTIGLLENHDPAWFWPSEIINTINFPALLGLIYLFPNSKFQPRGLAWLLLVQTILFLPIPLKSLNFPVAFNTIFTLSFVVSCIAVPVYRYRRIMTPVERQQTKWVVFGIVLAMVGIAITITTVSSPQASCDTRNLFCDAVQNIGYSLSPLMIPIFIGIGILRSRLWDIDVILRRTLVWGAITVLLGLVYFGGVTLFQSIFTALSSSLNLAQAQSPLGIVLSTLAIAALFNPLRKRLQEFVDRRFYRRKYDAEQALASFASLARQEVDLEEISARLINVVEETMQPESVSFWLCKSSLKTRIEQGR